MTCTYGCKLTKPYYYHGQPWCYPHYAARIATYTPAIDSERWADIGGYRTYQISDMGRLRRFKPDGSIRYLKGGRLYVTKGRNPYIVYKIGRPSLGQITKSLPAHRLVAKAFIANPDNKPHVNHIDGNPSNNKVENLEWCTHQENIIHAVRTGLKTDEHSRGEKNRTAKLTNVQAINIKHCKGSVKSNVLARYYPVTASTIRVIWSGVNWSNVDNYNRPRKIEVTQS